jgi:hypothetical protein
MLQNVANLLGRFSFSLIFLDAFPCQNVMIDLIFAFFSAMEDYLIYKI